MVARLRDWWLRLCVDVMLVAMGAREVAGQGETRKVEP